MPRKSLSLDYGLSKNWLVMDTSSVQGTLYPLLHGLEEKGYLRSIKEREGKSLRRLYQATPLGRKALVAARQKVSELFGELLEDK